MSSKTKKWIKCSLIRALRTMSQTALSLIPTAVMISEVDWLVVLSTSLTAGIISILYSIKGLPEVK